MILGLLFLIFGLLFIFVGFYWYDFKDKNKLKEFKSKGRTLDLETGEIK